MTPDPGYVAKMGKKRPAGASTLDLARRRIRDVFDRFDRVAVSFSGGKDSTACLNLALEVVAERSLPPLDVVFYDEEAIPPETVEYVARVAARPDVALRWYCLPTEQRNACSRDHPHWYPWAPEDRDRWVRPLPASAIVELEGFRRDPIPKTIGLAYPPSSGNVAMVMGIRADESMTRFRAIAARRGPACFYSPSDFPWITKAYPVYDWHAEDIWLAPDLLGWDYNRAYDVMAAAGLSVSQSRCSPPFGEQPIRGLWRFKSCWPELWARMVDRVPGAATAARYANTELYAFGDYDKAEDERRSWREMTLDRIATLPPDARAVVAKAIGRFMRDHGAFTTQPVPDATPHPVTGFSWKEIYRIALVGHDKLERQSQKVRQRAMQRRMKAGTASRPVRPFTDAEIRAIVARVGSPTDSETSDAQAPAPGPDRVDRPGEVDAE